MRKVIFGNGSEFRRNFIPLLKYFSVKPTCTTIKYPQANGILERIHQVVSSMLKTKDLTNVTFDAIAPWSKIVVSMVYVVRCSCRSTLQATAGQLVFGRDMILDIYFQPGYKEMCIRNAILERIHQLVSSMLNTKDLTNVTFDAIAPWSKIVVSMVYVVRCS